MGLIEQVKSAMFGETAERTFRYHCQACDTRFESTESSATAVACPECGTTSNRSIFKL